MKIVEWIAVKLIELAWRLELRRRIGDHKRRMYREGLTPWREKR